MRNYNIIQLFTEDAKKNPDSVRIATNSERWTSGRILSSAKKLAMYLSAKGVEPGDRIVTIDELGPELIVSWLAAWWTGAVVAPLLIQYSREEVVDFADTLDAKAFILGGRHARNTSYYTSHAISSELCIQTACGGCKDSLALQDILTSTDAASEIAVRDQNDDAMLMYSGGTTGKPKCAVVSHRYLWAFGEYDMPQISECKRRLTLFPGAHITVVFAVFRSWTDEATTICLPQKEWLAEYVSSASLMHEADMLMAMNSKLEQLSLEWPRDSVSGLRLLTGGSPTTPDQKERFEHAFGERLIICYGSTETNVVSMTELNGAFKAGVVGRPLVPTRIDESSNEILVDSKNGFSGYLNDPNNTKRIFQDGWLRTGDTGEITEGGSLRLFGRLSDMIICGGFNIFPEEIESKIALHSDVVSVKVVAKEDALLGEVPVAFVCVKNEVSQSELSTFARGQLPSHKRPLVRVIREMPLTKTGKIDQSALRLLAQDDTKKKRIEEVVDWEDQFDTLLRDSLGVDELPENWRVTPFFELGLDSVGVVELTSHMNRFGAELSATAMFRFPTFASLVSEIERQDQSDGRSPEPIGVLADSTSLTARENEPVICGRAIRSPGASNWQDFSKKLADSQILTGRDRCFERFPCALLGDNDRSTMDASFFGLSRLDAVELAPEYRLVMQTAWECIEDAGLAPTSLSGRRVGIIIAALDRSLDGKSSILNRSASMVGARFAHFLDLKGPVLSIDTACSSGLTAISTACQHLRSGDCEHMLVVSANGIDDEFVFEHLSDYGATSVEGTCATFDQSGNGYGRAEAICAFLLSTKVRALQLGLGVYAQIRASSLNHDGTATALTAPNLDAQADVIALAQKEAKVTPEQLDFLEVHGTGTPLGDPIEIEALRQAGFQTAKKTSAILREVTCWSRRNVSGPHRSCLGSEQL